MGVNERSVLLTPMKQLFQTIYEDDDLLVINKPADLVCHPTKGDVYSSLISRVRLYLKEGAEAHMINRLDRETSGLVVVAKHLPAATELRRSWESRKVEKTYLAIVHGHIRQDAGRIEGRLAKDTGSKVAIKDWVFEHGAESCTEFEVQSRFSREEKDFTFVRVRPLTGRKHQIRIHLSYYGHPIVGDKLYGINEDYYLALVEGRLNDAMRGELMLPFHALHAAAVRFPWREEVREFHAEPESWFTRFLSGE